MSREERQLQLNEFLVKDIVSQRIPFQFDVHCFAGDVEYTRVPVVITLQGESLTRFQQRRSKDSIALEVHCYLLSEDNIPVDHFLDKLVFDTPELIRQLSDRGVKYYGLLLAEPGRYKIKCILRDDELGMISADIHRVEVPDFNLGELRLSGPVFLESDKAKKIIINEQSKEPTGRREGKPVSYPFVFGTGRWVPAVNPEVGFSTAQLLFVRIHGLQTDPVVKEPVIDLGLEIIDESGGAAPFSSWAVIDQSENESYYDLIFRVDLNEVELEPGQYRLRFKLADRTSGSSAAADAPFVVQGER